MKIKASTQTKIVKVLASLDAKSASAISAYLNNEVSAKDAKANLDAAAAEVQKLYAAIRGIASSSKASFITAASDSKLDNILTDLSVIATRIDLANRLLEAEIEEEDNGGEDGDVTTDDILNELGVQVDGPDNGSGSDTNPGNGNDDAAVGNGSDDDDDDDDVAFDDDDDDDDDVAFDDDEGMTAPAAPNQSTAKVNKFKATRTVSKKRSAGRTPLMGLFNFIK